MTTVQDILTFMEGLAPYELAESWDNVGLLCGDRAQEVTSVLCALDVTETVVQEAAERGAQLVVAHHPAIFTSVSRVTSDDTTGRVLRYAIKHDISIICMHTNADCAEGGVNDALASALFLTNVVSMEAGENGMLGRVGDLPREMQPREFALYVKECLRAGGCALLRRRQADHARSGRRRCLWQADGLCSRRRRTGVRHRRLQLRSHAACAGHRSVSSGCRTLPDRKSGCGRVRR